MGHGSHPPIPDWKTYKIDANTPALVRVQQELAAHGLKDPWLRNNAWRHDMRMNVSQWHKIKKTTFRGFGYGLALAIAHASIGYALSSKDGHDKH